MSNRFPYAERFGVNRTLPEHGRPREEVLEELRMMAKEEDAFWETGKCSGTMYCGDHEHYDYLNEAFGLFAHMNALQRDMCPSSTRFEGEIIAMGLDLFHADAITDSQAGRARDVRRHRQHHARRARLPRARRADPRRRPAELREAGDRRTRRSTRPATCSGSRSARRRSTPPRPRSTCAEVAGHDRRADDRDHRVGRATTATARSTRSASSPSWRSPAGRRAARRRLPRRVHPPVRAGARLRHPGVRLPPARRHEHLGGHPQVRLLAEGHVVPGCARQGAAQRAVLPPARRGPGASTPRPASTARARPGCSPRRGRRWCTSGATATGATPSRSSRPPTR